MARPTVTVARGSVVVVRPWSTTADGLVVVVRLTPKGGRDAIDGVETLADGRSVLKVRVRAVASDGEANASLVKLLAQEIGIAPRDVALVGGATARIKRLKVSGAPSQLVSTLEKIAGIR